MPMTSATSQTLLPYEEAPSDERSVPWDALIAREIARIDRVISQQVAEVYNAQPLQDLESLWLNLADLVEFGRQQKGFGKRIKIKVLHASLENVGNDFGEAEFVESAAIYEKVYGEEFGSPGGEPFTLLIGNYSISEGFSTESPLADLDILKAMAKLGSAAFVPFVCSADPSIFAIEKFSELTNRAYYHEMFSAGTKVLYRNLRLSSDSHFIGLTVPDIVVRAPYHERWWPAQSFIYHETDVKEPALMGRSVFAFAKSLINSFSQSSWFNGITGHWFDDRGLHHKNLDVVAEQQDERLYEKRLPDVLISEGLEKSLSQWGFIPLMATRGLSGSYFNTCQSVSEKTYSGSSPVSQGFQNFESRLAMMLQYVLYVSRFAHYIKVLIRDRIGRYQTADECQRFLENWISDYVVGNDNASAALKTRKPIKEVKISVHEVPERPGALSCSVMIQPHFYGANVSTSVAIVSEPNHVAVG